jgi:hypothetical protein
MGSVVEHQRRRSYEWLLRAFAMALVLIAHLSLLMIMLRPAARMDEESTNALPDDHDAVRVRLIRRVSSAASIPSPEHRIVAISHAALPARRATRPMQISNQPSPLQPPDESAPLVLTPPASSSSTYVAGGSSFQQRLGAADHPYETKVPGDYQPRAPRFAMKDPRNQGAAGVVRFIRHYFPQMVDSHCVDVNTWAGMSPAEQAKHATLSEMKAIAEEHGCTEPERFPNTTH